MNRTWVGPALAVMFAAFHAAPAWAQAPAPRALMLAPRITEHDTSAAPHGVFYESEASVDYACGSALLSSSPDGRAPLRIDDMLEAAITRPDGSVRRVTLDFRSPDHTRIIAVPAFDLSGLLERGTNRIQLRLSDVLPPARSADPVHLVLAQCPTPTPPPSPTAVPSSTPVPPPPALIVTRVVVVTPTLAPVPTPEEATQPWSAGSGLLWPAVAAAAIAGMAALLPVIRGPRRARNIGGWLVIQSPTRQWKFDLAAWPDSSGLALEGGPRLVAPGTKEEAAIRLQRHPEGLLLKAAGSMQPMVLRHDTQHELGPQLSVRYLNRQRRSAATS